MVLYIQEGSPQQTHEFIAMVAIIKDSIYVLNFLLGCMLVGFSWFYSALQVGWSSEGKVHHHLITPSALTYTVGSDFFQ